MTAILLTLCVLGQSCYDQWSACYDPLATQRYECYAACSAAVGSQIDACDVAKDRCRTLDILRRVFVCFTGPGRRVLVCHGVGSWALVGGQPLWIQRCLPADTMPYSPCGWTDKDDDGDFDLRDWAEIEAKDWDRHKATQEGVPFRIGMWDGDKGETP